MIRTQPRGRQRGVALIAFVLVVLTAVSYLLFSGLNRKAASYSLQEETWQALREAREALIGYAVAYPDRINPRYGPGYLPCPDDDNDGTARTACALATASTTGRLPWRTLDVNDLRDASGERLWYALSENFRNNPHLQPLNSDTAGQLSVDDTDDIVAVIIAPGPVLPGQNRAVATTDPAQYLDGDNATVTDTTYSARAGNDTVLAITRGELMGAIEKRVAGDVARGLQRYYAAFGGYPWLSPFQRPDLADFHARTGMTSGLLAVHSAIDPNPGANENPFVTPLSFNWTGLGNAAVSITDSDPNNDFPLGCITDGSCVDPDFGAISLATSAAVPASCQWFDPDPESAPPARNYARCTATFPTLLYIKQYAPGLPGRLERTYQVTFSLADTSLDGADITPPTATTLRTRAIQSSNLADPDPLDDAQALQITIFQRHYALFAGYPEYTINVQITADGDTVGNVVASGINYDLDADAGEVPPWLTSGDWHQLVYVDYAAAYAPGGGGNCIAAANCLTLRVERPLPAGAVDIANQRGVVLVAGRSLGAARPAADLAGYYENENDNDVSANATYQRAAHDLTFNDEVRTLGTAP